MRFIILILFLMASLKSHALEILENGDTLIKVLSYNVKCLPFPKSCKKAKMQKIGEILNERRKTNSHPDIVLIQEGFVDDFQLLVKASGYKNILKGPNVGDENPDETLGIKKVVGSGLWILTDLPMIHSAKRVFKNKDCTSWDCYSNKGLLFANIEVNKQLVSIVTTHMNSGPSDKAEKMRGRQVDEAAKFLNSYYYNTTPLIFAGDFNLRPERENYYPLLKKTKTISAGLRCLESLDCKISEQTPEDLVVEKTVDHHLINPSFLNTLYPVFTDRNFTEEYDGKMLSDHLGYEVHYILKRK